MFPGIVDRMHKELTALSPSSMKVCLTAFSSCSVFNLRSDGFE